MNLDNHPDQSLDVTLTPLSLINKLDIFDLDPCGFPGHQTANKIITLPDDGLTSEWNGRVWLNPPYSKPLPWLKKLSEHGNGIAFVLASTDTTWFQDYIGPYADSILFIRGRPFFQRRDGSPVKLMRASILVAYGKENAYILSKSRIPGWLSNGTII